MANKQGRAQLDYVNYLFFSPVITADGEGLVIEFVFRSMCDTNPRELGHHERYFYVGIQTTNDPKIQIMSYSLGYNFLKFPRPVRHYRSYISPREIKHILKYDPGMLRVVSYLNLYSALKKTWRVAAGKNCGAPNPAFPYRSTLESRTLFTSRESINPLSTDRSLNSHCTVVETRV